MILFIDEQLDDPAAITVHYAHDMVDEIAKRHGIVFVAIPSAEEGLKLALENFEKIRLIIVDADFGKQVLHGLDIVRKVRKASKEVKIMAFSSFSENNADLLAFGANYSFLKNFTCDEDLDHFKRYVESLLKIG